MMESTRFYHNGFTFSSCLHSFEDDLRRASIFTNVVRRRSSLSRQLFLVLQLALAQIGLLDLQQSFVRVDCLPLRFCLHPPAILSLLQHENAVANDLAPPPRVPLGFHHRINGQIPAAKHLDTRYPFQSLPSCFDPPRPAITLSDVQPLVDLPPSLSLELTFAFSLCRKRAQE